MSAEHWTAADLPDLTGHRCVVTGANSGLGYWTALELARHGADVVLACRDALKGDEALERLRVAVPEARAELRALDLADLTSVRSFAAGLTVDVDRLDVLVNNAGLMAIPRRTTADGFEMQLGVNHLGHFALTGLLLPVLLRGSVPGGPARVVSVASGAHRMGRVRRDDLMGERRYAAWAAYGQSKLANLLFAAELQRRADAAGAPLASLAAHPGYAATNLQLVGPQMSGSALRARLAGLGNALFGQSAEHGAWPTLRAAADPGAVGGQYYGPSGFLELRGTPRPAGRSSQAENTEDAAWLWDRSSELTGVTYAFSAPPPTRATGG